MVLFPYPNMHFDQYFIFSSVLKFCTEYASILLLILIFTYSYLRELAFCETERHLLLA